MHGLIYVFNNIRKELNFLGTDEETEAESGEVSYLKQELRGEGSGILHPQARIMHICTYCLTGWLLWGLCVSLSVPYNPKNAAPNTYPSWCAFSSPLPCQPSAPAKYSDTH